MAQEFGLEKRLVIGTTMRPPACHSITAVDTGGGRLLAVWYACSYEVSPDSVLYAAHWDPTTERWSEPWLVADPPLAAVGNPVLVNRENPVGDTEAAAGSPRADVKVELYSVVVYGREWTAAHPIRQESNDSGRHWSMPEALDVPQGIMTKNKPALSRDGTLLLPVYDEALGGALVLKESRGDNASGERRRAGSDGWRLLGDTTCRHNALQPALVRRDDGSLLLLSRTKRGAVWQSVSYNEGESWTASVPTEVANPNSGIDVLSLGDDTLILACNDQASGRSRMSLYRSEDGGQSWRHWNTLEDAKEGEYSYPWLLQDEAGTVHLLYTEHRVNFAHWVITEEELRS
jgi:predicted neuraminidase